MCMCRSESLFTERKYFEFRGEADDDDCIRVYSRGLPADPRNADEPIRWPLTGSRAAKANAHSAIASVARDLAAMA